MAGGGMAEMVEMVEMVEVVEVRATVVLVTARYPRSGRGQAPRQARV